MHLKQWQRRPQRERHKFAYLVGKNNSFARPARVFFTFVHFFAVSCKSTWSFSKDDGYGYGNATKQEYYWLQKEKCSCCTCNTNFRAFLCRTPQNNNVKSPNIRFWRQREHLKMKKSFSVLTLKPFVPIHLQDSSPVLYNVNKTD